MPYTRKLKISVYDFLLSECLLPVLIRRPPGTELKRIEERTFLPYRLYHLYIEKSDGRSKKRDRKTED